MADTNSGWDGRGARGGMEAARAQEAISGPGVSGPGGTGAGASGPGSTESGSTGPSSAGSGVAGPGVSSPGVSGPAAPGPRTARSRRVTAVPIVSIVALAALATACEPGTATGAQDAPPPVRATQAAAPTASPSPTASATDDAEPPTASPTTPPPSPKASTAAPARPAPEPSTAPPPRVLMRTGSQSDQVRELQARLRQIGHFGRNPTGYYGSVTADAVRSFQAKRRLTVTGSADEVTWKRLLAMTRGPTAAELHPPTERPVATPDERCLKGRVLCISKKSRTLAWMIDGKVVSAMDVRFGSEYTPTREGVFEVFWKSRDHVSTLYDTPMPYALFFSGGQAVHYSADFAANGYGGASHGCVNVRDKKKVAALFDQVKNGDKVVVSW
ncbi:L,D-transpeptidase family protein [Streptomyces sp. BPSDS2]|uniref:L,D-transpeptidase family protein n=1 Tax=Streptomyces sp. BPSDS2 TaxID=2571021 RepID=UPI001F0CEEFC|nr:L,D-transpeptidase family protein [Streptomyces sp. BPSDS2]